MHDRHRLNWLGLTVILLVCPTPGRTQPPPRLLPWEGESIVPAELRNRSHGALESPVNAEDLLDQRLRRLKELHGLQDFVQKVLTDPKKYGVDPQTIAKLKRNQAQGTGQPLVDPRDPQVRKLLEKILEERTKQGQPLPKLAPDQVEAWQRLRPRSPEEPPQAEPAPPSTRRPSRVAPSEPRPPSAEDSKADASGPGAASPLAGQVPTPERRQMNPQVAEQFRKFFDKVRNVDPALRNSPALRQAMQGLQNYTPPDDRWSGLANQVGRLQERVGDWTSQIRLDPKWSDMDWLAPRQLRPGSLSGLGWLGGRGSWIRMPSWNGPRLSTPQPSGQALGWGLAWLLAIGVGMLFVWKALAWRQAKAAARFRTGRGLGPWPVHPGAVRTAEELIQAFEYLSVLRLGAVARSWNHLAIAAGLAGETAASVAARLTQGLPWAWKKAAERVLDALPARGTSDEHSLAAAHLAALYEQARYAPPGEPLPEAALAAARRDLCFLGGVPAT